MPAKSGFVLTSDDIEYLRSVYLLRVASIDHLAALSWRRGQSRSYTRTQKRTAKLAVRGYLNPLTKPPGKRLYALGREGVEALVELGYAPEELWSRRRREKELKPLFLDHLISVKDIQVMLIALARGTSLRIERWSEGAELYDSIVIPGEEQRIPVRPDALFVLQDASRPEGKNTMSFVLEADRSTESHERIRTKIRGYLAYADQGRAREKWRLASKYFRVLVVTRTAVRANNLRNDLQSAIPAQLRSHYLFTDMAGLTGDLLLT